MNRQSILKKLKPDAESALDLAVSFSALTEIQRNWQPSPQRWSVNQCLEHINRTNRLWLKNFGHVLKNGRKSENKGDFFHKGIGGFMVRSLMPGNKGKFKTAKKFIPPSLLDSKVVWDDFVLLQQKWIELMDDIQPYDLVKNRVASPFIKWIRYRIGDALVLNNMHTHRHLNQAINVTKENGFPK